MSIVLIATGAFLQWRIGGTFALGSVGYEHPPYLIVGSIALVTVLTGLIIRSDQTAFFAIAVGYLVTLTAAGEWSGGRFYAFSGGLLLSAVGVIRLFPGTDFELPDISAEGISPSLDGVSAFVLVLGTIAVLFVSSTHLGFSPVDYLGSFIAAACLIGISAIVCLYWWNRSVRRTILAWFAILATVIPIHLLVAPEAHFVRGVGIIVVAAGWLLLGATIAVGYELPRSLPYMTGESERSGPTVDNSAMAGGLSIPFLLVLMGVTLLLLAGYLPWHFPMIPPDQAPLGIELTVFMLVIPLALAIGFVGFVTWTPRTSSIALAGGAIIPFLVRGFDPLVGGRFLAIVGGLVIALGGLIGSMYGPKRR